MSTQNNISNYIGTNNGEKVVHISLMNASPENLLREALIKNVGKVPLVLTKMEYQKSRDLFTNVKRIFLRKPISKRSFHDGLFSLPDKEGFLRVIGTNSSHDPQDIILARGETVVVRWDASDSCNPQKIIPLNIRANNGREELVINFTKQANKPLALITPFKGYRAASY